MEAALDEINQSTPIHDLTLLEVKRRVETMVGRGALSAPESTQLFDLIYEKFQEEKIQKENDEDDEEEDSEFEDHDRADRILSRKGFDLFAEDFSVELCGQQVLMEKKEFQGGSGSVGFYSKAEKLRVICGKDDEQFDFEARPNFLIYVEKSTRLEKGSDEEED